MTEWPTPKSPVLSWGDFFGPRAADAPCLLDQPRVSLTTSGRAAILLALEALGVGAGDTVLVPTYHCPTMVAPVVLRGAKPVFYPIDASGAPQLAWIERHVPRKAKALLVAHFFGQAQPMSILRRWCNDRGVALIEDCAHTLFGSSDKQPVGSWGDLAIGSLTKFLPVPAGGCLVNPRGLPIRSLTPTGAVGQLRSVWQTLEAAARSNRLAGLNHLVRGLAHWRQQAPPEPAAATAGPTPDRTGSDSKGGPEAQLAEQCVDARWATQRIPTIGASLARLLPRGATVERRRQNAGAWRQALAATPGMRPLWDAPAPEIVPYVFALWVDRPDPGYAELRRLGLPVSRWDTLWPGTPRIEGDHGRLWAHHVLQLACHQSLQATDIQRSAEALARHCSAPVSNLPTP